MNTLSFEGLGIKANANGYYAITILFGIILIMIII